MECIEGEVNNLTECCNIYASKETIYIYDGAFLKVTDHRLSHNKTLSEIVVAGAWWRIRASCVLKIPNLVESKFGRILNTPPRAGV
jgi:hypothetical protein